jgi:hypothetical protein
MQMDQASYDIVRVLEECAICLDLSPEQQNVLCRKAWRYCVDPKLVLDKTSNYWIDTACHAILKTGLKSGSRCTEDALPDRMYCYRHAPNDEDEPDIPLGQLRPEKSIKPTDVVCKPNRFGNVCYPNTNYILDKTNQVIAREGPTGEHIELTAEDREECRLLRLRVK